MQSNTVLQVVDGHVLDVQAAGLVEVGQPEGDETWDHIADSICAKISAYCEERGLHVTFSSFYANGPSRKVYLAEAAGLWLKDRFSESGHTVDASGEIGRFQTQYQHLDSELKGIKHYISEVISLRVAYQAHDFSNITFAMASADIFTD